jgi:hypothetical protein
MLSTDAITVCWNGIDCWYTIDFQDVVLAVSMTHACCDHDLVLSLKCVNTFLVADCVDTCILTLFIVVYI